MTDSPAGDGLACLAAYARGGDRLRLGVGVLPLDRHPPEAIIERVRELGLPLDRLWLGIGSGRSATPLGTVRAAVPVLREALPGASIVIAAMGPQMCALAGEIGDAVHLNWLTPEAIRDTMARIEGREPRPLGVMYVRASLDPGGRERVGVEAGRYARQPGMATHFEANGVPPSALGVAGVAGTFDAQLAPYEAVLDATIVRALPASAEPADLCALLEACAPA